MKSAGVTLRRLTIIYDRMALDLRAKQYSLDWEIRKRTHPQFHEHNPYDRDRERDLLAKRDRISVAMERYRVVIAGLADIYASGELDMPGDVIMQRVLK